METSQPQRFLPVTPPPAIAESVCLLEAQRAPLPRDELFYPMRADGACLLLGPVSGRISFLADALAAECSAGQALLLLPETEAVVRAAEDTLLDCVTLRGTLVDRLLRETAEQGPFFPRAAALGETVSALLRAEESGAAPDGRAASAAAFSLLTQLYGKSAAPGESAYPALVVTAIGIMREEFAYLYGVEELADRLHVTKNHLIRVFTASVGVSPGRYLTGLRIEYAKLVLRSGELSLDAVSAAAGFSGPDYFGKVFRKETGMTPRRYAAAHPPAPEMQTGELYV